MPSGDDAPARPPSPRFGAGAGLPPALASHWEWQQRGSCRRYSVEMFYPDEKAGIARHEAIEAAKAVCRECPVLQPCREFAFAVPERWGIWGALTPFERNLVLATESPRGQ